ncbi:MAG TPA: hypothetical protein VG501_10115 [Rhizomicrobium sp.]|nr:hypothetical protein [Rhizomicrobium sp.]
MSHRPRVPLGFQPAGLDDACKLSQPVTVYCLNCTRSRLRSSERLLKLKGDLKFGMLHGGFWCSGCRASAVVVIFPCTIKTPRDWVRYARGAEF